MVDGIGRAQQTNVQANKPMQPLQNQGKHASVQNTTGLILGSAEEQGDIGNSGDFGNFDASRPSRPFAQLLREQTGAASLKVPNLAMAPDSLNIAGPKNLLLSKAAVTKNPKVQEPLLKKIEESQDEDERPSRTRTKKLSSPKVPNASEDSESSDLNFDANKAQNSSDLLRARSAFWGPDELQNSARVNAAEANNLTNSRQSTALQRTDTQIGDASSAQQKAALGSVTENTAVGDDLNANATAKAKFYRLSDDLKKQLGFEVNSRPSGTGTIDWLQTASALNNKGEDLNLQEIGIPRGATTSQLQSPSNLSKTLQISGGNETAARAINYELSTLTNSQEPGVRIQESLNLKGPADLFSELGSSAAANSQATQLQEQRNQEPDFLYAAANLGNLQALKDFLGSGNSFQEIQPDSKPNSLEFERNSQIPWNRVFANSNRAESLFPTLNSLQESGFRLESKSSAPLSANDLADALSDPLTEQGLRQSALFAKRDFLENYKKLAGAFDEATLTFQAAPEAINAPAQASASSQQSQALFNLQAFKPRTQKDSDLIAGASNTQAGSGPGFVTDLSVSSSLQPLGLDTQTLNAQQTLSRQQSGLSPVNSPNGGLNMLAMQQSLQTSLAQNRQAASSLNSRDAEPTWESFESLGDADGAEPTGRATARSGSSSDVGLFAPQNDLHEPGAAGNFNGSGTGNQGDNRLFGKDSLNQTNSLAQSAQDSASALTEMIRSRTNEVVDRMIVQGGTGQAKLSLRDSIVGAVDVTVEVGASKKLSVEINADKKDVKEKIESQLETLRDSLKGHEFKSVEIHLGAEKTSSGTGNSSQQSRQNDGQREAMNQNQNGFLNYDQGSGGGNQSNTREQPANLIRNVERQGETLGKRIYAERSKASINQKGNLSFRA